MQRCTAVLLSVNFKNSRIWQQGEIISDSRSLIALFSKVSKKLRSDGLANMDAFAEFSQILFFKLFSELSDANDIRANNLPVHWSTIKDRFGDDLLDSYNNALKKLSRRYEGVFTQKTEILSHAILSDVIQALEKYSFSAVRADVKGEAYEYFLRQYNKQKSELAQYFTPRHVVSAMVALCDPKFGEKVYDPFCGTGGMLIEAFRYIKKNVNNMNAECLKELQQGTIFGNDVSRTASAAKMNMILAGDGHSGISRRDSLNVVADGDYDVVITNIPFNRDNEKDFVRHCFAAVAGRPAGRVCMIVPERILDAQEYTELRKSILQHWSIKRVVSLPREVFRGLTTAKTSIIYALWGDGFGNEKQGHKNLKTFIPYITVENDGYTLDKKRDPIPGQNDLDIVIETRHDKIACSQHYASTENSFAFKPCDDDSFTFGFGTVPLGDLVSVKKQEIIITAEMLCREPRMKNDHTIALKEERAGLNVKVKKRYLILPGDLVFARLHTQNGLFAYSDAEYHGTATHLVCRVDEKKVDKDFLFWVLDLVISGLSKEDTTGRENYKDHEILSLPIPLPSLDEQKQMVIKISSLAEKMKLLQNAFGEEKKAFALGLFTG